MNTTLRPLALAMCAYAADGEPTNRELSGIQGVVMVSPSRPGPIKKGSESPNMAPLRNAKFNLKKEFITEEELLSQLRQQGIENIEDVRECYLESNGHFSVLKRFRRTQNQSNAEPMPAVN